MTCVLEQRRDLVPQAPLDEPVSPRRPLVVVLGLALCAGALASAGPLVAAAGLGLSAGVAQRLRGVRLHGLSLHTLAAWLAVATLHASTSEPHAPSTTGVWRVDASDGETVLGHLEGGAGSFELPLGTARDGEVLRLRPVRAPNEPARPPSFVRRRASSRAPRRVEADEVERLSARGRTPMALARRALRDLRAAGLERVERLECEGTRGLSAALLFGDRSHLPRGTSDLFTRTGTRHALAVSGLHVGLVAVLWIWPLGSLLARLLGRGRAASWLRKPEPWRAGLLVALVPLAGAGAPVVRAALALALAQLASVFPQRLTAEGVLAGARRADALTLWALALLLEWLADPGCLRSISVLLSYGATLGLLVHGAAVLAWLRRWLPGGGEVAAVGRLGHPRPPAARLLGQRLLDLTLAGLAASFAANLATLPVVWFVFGEWSWVGALSTLLLLPLLAAFLGVAWAWVACPCEALEALLDALSWAQLALLETLDRLPGTPANLPARPACALALVALLTLLAAHRPVSRRLALAGWSLLILPWRGPARELEVHALDVGHGTAVVIRAPRGPTWLFDAGSRDRPGVAREALAPLLRELDVGPLVVVLSHGEADHAGALPWLLERYPPVAWVGALPAHLGERLPHDVPRFDLEQGRLALDFGSAGEAPRAALLRGLDGHGNEGSRDLELEWRGRKLLLCGDAEQRGRGRGLRAGLVRGPYDLLLFPHHGSDTPWLGPLLEQARPAEVWFSASERPAVADELDRLGQPWRSTHVQGALTGHFEPASDATLARPGTEHAITEAPIRRP